jgi:membrane-bound lytic murein transglycosylase B
MLMTVYHTPPKIKQLSASLLMLFLFAGGCASQPEKPVTISKTPSLPKSVVTITNPNLNPEVGAYHASNLSGDYANYPALKQFIEDMVQKYGFKREYLNGLFSQAKRKQWTLDYLTKSDQGIKGKPSPGGWTKYRAQFVDAKHINTGIAFWHQYQSALQRAHQQYGVPPEYILGIIGVETGFGANFGNHRIIDALTTLSFDYQRRGDFFRSELEKFLIMTNRENLDPSKPVGSFAGAMGFGQFMPSSFLEWSVDFNGDNRRDLWNPEDAIGSVANYFAQHGWQPNKPVVSSVRGYLSGAQNLEPGIDQTYSLETLTQAGITPADNCPCNYPLRLLLLRHIHNDEYLLGHPNFYTISRYNHSTYYVMAVHELAQAFKKAHGEKAKP